MIKKQPVRFNASIQLSNISKNFILSCLNASEKKRISWKDLFSHPIFGNDDHKPSSTATFIATISGKIKNNLIKIQKQYIASGKSIVEIFKKFDQDEDVDSFTFSEFQAFLKEFDQNISFREQKMLFDEFDKDKSGQISLDEFTNEIFGTSFDNYKENSLLSNMKTKKIIKELKGYISNT